MRSRNDPLHDLQAEYGQFTPEKPLVPPSQWGTKDKFRKYRWRSTKRGKKRVRRCQAFAKSRIRRGLRSQHAQCTLHAAKGSNYCKYHGGGREIAAATIDQEMDRYAQHMPQDLKDRYMAAKTDPELLSARNEVELMTARVGQVIERLKTGESAQAWQQVIEAEIVLRQALRSNNPESLMMGLRTAHGMLRDATKKTDVYVWRELEGLLHSRTKLADVESSRLIAQKQYLTVEQLVSIAADLQREMYTVITDMHMRQQIARIFRGTFLGQDSDIPEEGLEDDRYRWGTVEGQRGCYMCVQKHFRMRQQNTDGWYNCPYCKTAWEPAMQAPDDTIIDVAPRLLEAADLEQETHRQRSEAPEEHSHTEETGNSAFTNAATSGSPKSTHPTDPENNTSTKEGDNMAPPLPLPPTPPPTDDIPDGGDASTPSFGGRSSLKESRASLKASNASLTKRQKLRRKVKLRKKRG